ncbi:hypothetical protein CP8484711_1852A, partial [Chlamydia psittaci 84-8471/1]
MNLSGIFNYVIVSDDIPIWRNYKSCTT